MDDVKCSYFNTGKRFSGTTFEPFSGCSIVGPCRVYGVHLIPSLSTSSSVTYPSGRFLLRDWVGDNPTPESIPSGPEYDATVGGVTMNTRISIPVFAGGSVAAAYYMGFGDSGNYVQFDSGVYIRDFNTTVSATKWPWQESWRVVVWHTGGERIVED